MNHLNKYKIEAMDCPTEETMIRGKLEKMEGISHLDFNLIQRVLTVEHQLKDSERIRTSIESLGFQAVDLAQKEQKEEESSTSLWKEWLPWILAGIAALGAEIAELTELWTPWAPAVFALTAVLLCGISTFKKGWLALINGSLNINALMSIAVTGALFLKVWPEAAMVMVLFALSEKIEALSLDRARNAISSLLKLSPQRALLLLPDGSWVETEAEQVTVGSVVRVRPGERISHDGIVRQGTTVIDQSAITGESIPVEKAPGQEVFAGTVNQHGEIQVEVTAEASRSLLSRIIHLVEEAQSNRSATQRFVDSFARVYTPIVLGISVLVALIPPLLMQEPWLDWIYRALVLLIIACPCALVISTPVTIVSGLAKASRLGIIIKGGVFLEQAAKLEWAAFDKTGTITTGLPILTDSEILSDNTRALQVALQLALRSDHPVSQAIAEGLKQQLDTEKNEVTTFQALPGKGVRGTFAGREYYMGNHRLVEELGRCSESLEKQLNTLEEKGKTAVILVDNQGPIALFGVADSIRESSRRAVERLHRLGVKSLLLSGDNQRTATAIGLQAGIDDSRGELLPEEKAAAINRLRDSGQRVAMAGDGINDAPALAHADIGIAMGGIGTDTAIEAADVVIMDDDIGKIPQLVSLSRKTRRLLGQNIGIALGIKTIFLALTLVGLGTMWMAVFADMGASLIVVFNGMRLLRWKDRK